MASQQTPNLYPQAYQNAVPAVPAPQYTAYPAQPDGAHIALNTDVEHNKNFAETPTPGDPSKEMAATGKVTEESSPKTPRIVEEDLVAHYQTVKDLPLHFKINIAICSIIVSICFLVWRYTTPEGFWWFIYPMFVAALSISIDFYFFIQKNYKGGAIAILAILNLICFFTWGLTQPKGVIGYPWFIYPIYATASGYTLVLYLATKRHELIFMFWHLYWQLSLMLFATWIFTSHGHPWFFYPMIALAIPLLCAMAKSVYHEKRAWVYLLIIFGGIDSIVFIVWAFTSSYWPWFIFVWVPTMAFVALAYVMSARGSTKKLDTLTVHEQL